MKQFQDLSICLNDFDANTVIDAITVNCANTNWERNLKDERELNNDSNNYSETQYFIFDNRKNGNNYAQLALIKNENVLQVCNILPIETGELNINEYNELLLDFKKIIPSNIDVHVSPDEINFKDEFGEDLVNTLSIFSKTANKSTGDAHRSDRNKWFNFILEAYKSGQELDAGLLEELLKEQGWSAKWADKLASQFYDIQEFLLFMKNDNEAGG